MVGGRVRSHGSPGERAAGCNRRVGRWVPPGGVEGSFDLLQAPSPLQGVHFAPSSGPSSVKPSNNTNNNNSDPLFFSQEFELGNGNVGPADVRSQLREARARRRDLMTSHGMPPTYALITPLNSYSLCVIIVLKH
mmetsp:Transcript_10163/g.15205  ORF Transcript_10163/g.15205 Transcript_10163/m.15205 type:complete len:135 (-) Transcript_10163:8-412(-)